MIIEKGNKLISSKGKAIILAAKINKERHG